MVPNRSKRKPLGSVRKLFIKEAMVKTSENCSSCPLQSVNTYNTEGEKHGEVKQVKMKIKGASIFNIFKSCFGSFLQILRFQRFKDDPLELKDILPLSYSKELAF